MGLARLVVELTLKGGAGSGHHGHVGIPGKVGGSAPSGIGVPAGMVPNLPAGTYSAVYSTIYNKQTALKKANQLGAGHVVVRINGQYHVIDTGDPTQAAGQPIYYSTTTGAKIAAGVTDYWAGKTGTGAGTGPAATAPPPPAKVYNSKVEELYDKAHPDAQEFARRYGILAQDKEALKYLKELEKSDPSWHRSALFTREQTYNAANQQSKNRQALNAAIDGRAHSTVQDSTGYVMYGATDNDKIKLAGGNPKTHKVMTLEDPLGRGYDGYVVVPKGFTANDLPRPDRSIPDFNTMVALRTQPATETAKHQAHADKNWNNYDNGGIKIKVKQSFEITMPQPLNDEYKSLRSARGGDTKFLYHGTDVNGAKGIVTSGFFVGDTPKIGRIHGNGTYLADQESKAAQYAHEGSGSKMSNSRAVMLINQVSLGNMKASDNTTGISQGSGEDLYPGVDTYKKTSTAYGGNPFKSNTWSNEYIVADPRAIQPRIWLDIERTPR